jgi:hypothetical protein
VDRRNKCGDDGGKPIVIASREAAWRSRAAVYWIASSAFAS